MFFFPFSAFCVHRVAFLNLIILSTTSTYFAFHISYTRIDIPIQMPLGPSNLLCTHTDSIIIFWGIFLYTRATPYRVDTNFSNQIPEWSEMCFTFYHPNATAGLYLKVRSPESTVHAWRVHLYVSILAIVPRARAIFFYLPEVLRHCLAPPAIAISSSAPIIFTTSSRLKLNVSPPVRALLYTVILLFISSVLFFMSTVLPSRLQDATIILLQRYKRPAYNNTCWGFWNYKIVGCKYARVNLKFPITFWTLLVPCPLVLPCHIGFRRSSYRNNHLIYLFVLNWTIWRQCTHSWGYIILVRHYKLKWERHVNVLCIFKCACTMYTNR